jgi:hypothetical protein
MCPLTVFRCASQRQRHSIALSSGPARVEQEKYRQASRYGALDLIAAIAFIPPGVFAFLFRGFFPWNSGGFVLSPMPLRLRHRRSAAHTYKPGTVAHEPPALHAMFRNGMLPVDFVKSRHPIWYERLNGGK